MGAEATSLEVQKSRSLVRSIRICYGYVCNHPFLVAMLCFLFLLYRLFPLLFKLLVSASPILVCTVGLLGTLLMFGNPNIPDVEKKKKEVEVSSDDASVKTGFQSDNTLSRNEYTVIPKMQEKNLNVAYESYLEESVGSHKGHHPGSSTRENEDEKADERKLEEDSDDEDNGDDNSDQAESWSPDASMADVVPILDELHPLLDMETLQPSHVSHDGSDASSERSDNKSDRDTVESDEENQVEEEDGDDDDEEEEEEGGATEGKQDESKSAITWTEDDQKNVMDLGSLELERNQRLESLIARRKARKTLSMMPDLNLIDFDSTDLPLNVPPVTTRRQNPFDAPHDSYDNSLPIPGSAPSIFAQRRNPFHIPYDSNEEKPDVKGDGIEQDFLTSSQKETAVFRRHESFCIGPSILGGNRRERLDSRLRPIFVLEQFAPEGTSYDSLNRQLSEISESKGSSVPDSDSVASIFEQDDYKLDEQELSQEAELAPDHHKHESQSSEDVETVYSEQLEEDVHHDEVEITLGGGGNQQEVELNLYEGQDAATQRESHKDETHQEKEPVEEEYSSRSSVSSLSEGYQDIPNMREEEGLTSVDAKGDHETSISKQHSPEESYFDDATMVMGDSLNTEVKEEEGLTSVDHKGGLVQQTSISNQSSEESYFGDANMAEDDSHHKEPVYDSSPPTMDKFLSFKSISSELQAEISEMCSTPNSLEVNVTFSDKELEAQESMEIDTPTKEQMSSSSSQVYTADGSSSGSREFSEVNEDDLDYQNGLAKQNSNNGDILLDSALHSPDNKSVKRAGTYEEGTQEHVDHEHKQVSSSDLDADIPLNARGKSESADNYNHVPSGQVNLSQLGDQQGLILVEHNEGDHPNSDSSETEPKKHEMAKENALQNEHHQLQLLSFPGDGALRGNMPYENRNTMHELEDVHSLNISSGENNQALLRQEPSFLEDRGPDIHAEQLSETQEENKGETSTSNNHVLLSEQQKVHVRSSDAQTDAGLHQNLNAEPISIGSREDNVAQDLAMPDRDSWPTALQKQHPSSLDKAPELHDKPLSGTKSENRGDNSRIEVHVLSPEEEKIHVSSLNADTADGLNQNLNIEEISSGSGLNSAAQGQQPSVLDKKAPVVHAKQPSETESEHREDTSRIEDHVLLSKEEEADVTSSDPEANAGLYQDSNVEATSRSSPQEVYSEQNSPSNMKKQPSTSDNKSLGELPSNNDDKPEVIQGSWTHLENLC